MRLIDRIRQIDPRRLKGPRMADFSATLAENELLRKHAAKQITDATLLTGINIHGGGMELGMKGGAAGLLAEMLAQQFKDGGAVNYLELTFESCEVMPRERFMVTIQRVFGETPSQQIKKLKTELAAALAQKEE